MEITWHGRKGWKNKGHEIEYGTAHRCEPSELTHELEYYFSVCGHRQDDPHFRVWVYCEKGWQHLGSENGFDSKDEAKLFADGWFAGYLARSKEEAEVAR